MTDRDLGVLLDRATEHLPEVDFADGAWADALATRARRRRAWTGGLGAVAAASVAVVALQLSDPPKPHPTPAYTTATPATTGTLADRSRFASLPPEGDEGALPVFEAGLPQVIDPHGRSDVLSRLGTPLPAVVAVFLRPEGRGYRPVVVSSTGQQVVVDTLLLQPTRDAAGNTAMPLGPRAFGAGRYLVFPQPGAVVRLDLRDGSVRRYAVPSPYVESAAWQWTKGLVTVRAGGRAWLLDPWQPGTHLTAVDPARPDGTDRLGVSTDTRSLGIAWFDPDTLAEVGQRSVPAPVTGLWGATVSSAQWTAVGAFLDQDITSPAIRRGSGPIYQGVIAVQPRSGKPTLLLAPENPDGQTGRFKGCCTVLGWSDAHTALVRTVGTHGSWVLAWDVTAGTVSRVTQVKGDAAKEEAPGLALNVGWRY